ncbi:MAG: hypothetical protein Q9209_005897 [Squamulea sp. 1 TL-2023]
MSLNMPQAELPSTIPREDEITKVAQTQWESREAEEDAQSVVGVSISRTQTRLRSPATPAAEKAAALGGAAGFFDQIQPVDQTEASPSALANNGPLQLATETSPVENSEVSNSRKGAPLPSPWTSKPKSFEESGMEPRRQIAQDTQRSPTAGPFGSLVDLNLKRFLSTFTMPSLPKTLNMRDMPVPTFSSLLFNKVNSNHDAPLGRQKRATTLLPQRSPWLPQRMGSASQTSPKAVENSSSSQGVRDRQSAQRSLKRSISDQSLDIRRASSLGSSLGDDTRWENVQKRVNSRAKAIADILQDSNIRLPSLPSVNLGSLRPDFLRGRAASDAARTSHTKTWYDSSSNIQGNAPGYQNGDLQANVRPQQPTVSNLQSSGTSSKPVPSHLTQALESLTGDILIMGGYRGSILRSAKPPYRQLWVPVKVGLNIRRVNLEVGLGLDDEDRMEDTIFSSGMLSHIGPVDMGRRLLKRLRLCRNAQEGKLRVHDYGYDWRLSPHLLSQRLIRFLKNLPSNTETPAGGESGVFVVAHSLGGLITRHAVNQHPELFAGIIYAGVPQYCINILGPLRDGDEVLLSSQVLTAQVNFTFRTSYLLLPDDGRCFIDKQTKEDYHVNFFDIAEWKRYAFSPCIAPTSPPFGLPERKGWLNFMADNFMALAPLGRKTAPSRFTLKNDPETTQTLSKLDTDPHINNHVTSNQASDDPQSTIPLAQAEEYLARTLATTVCFRDELKFDPLLSRDNRYPPLSVLYGTSVPTVYRARVASKAAIRCRDAYDDLAFASGDGVCLARAAMLPPGYRCVPGGKVRTERGHVGLLGDLEAVGRCLNSVIDGRKRGIGSGPEFLERGI